ncbi:MAG: hypothetical protein AAFY71_10965 [Bacteroidota bacterium]
MIPDYIPSYFNSEELNSLKAVEGVRLEKVLYTIWRNIAKKDAIYEALDWISLQFEDGQIIHLTTNEQQNGMTLGDLNFSLEQTKVIQQFNGQVELKQVDMSLSPIWKDVLGRPLDSVGLSSPLDGFFQSNVIQLAFSGKNIEISLGEEGLLAYEQ